MSDTRDSTAPAYKPATVTEEEKAARHAIVVREGLTATAVGLPFTLAGAWGLNRWLPLYRHLTPQFKLFTLLAANTGRAGWACGVWG
jgi:hypothetical protein